MKKEDFDAMLVMLGFIIVVGGLLFILFFG